MIKYIRRVSALQPQCVPSVAAWKARVASPEQYNVPPNELIDFFLVDLPSRDKDAA